MIATLRRIIGRNIFQAPIEEKGPAEAYDLWSENYDVQPGNLMLDLDEVIFPDLMNGIDLENKQVADIGCGTGRHWNRIFQKEPLSLTGFDVSAGMLGKLKQKFPQAHTVQITDDSFAVISDASYDMIVSTLTVAHIKNIEAALAAWCRMLKPTADMIITDFHPHALSMGGKRTFEHHKTQVAIQNFVHHVTDIERLLLKYNFHIVKRLERIVDESVKHYYVAKNALPVYHKFENCSIIYGLHLRRG